VQLRSTAIDDLEHACHTYLTDGKSKHSSQPWILKLRPTYSELWECHPGVAGASMMETNQDSQQKATPKGDPM